MDGISTQPMLELWLGQLKGLAGVALHRKQVAFLHKERRNALSKTRHCCSVAFSIVALLVGCSQLVSATQHIFGGYWYVEVQIGCLLGCIAVET